MGNYDGRLSRDSAGLDSGSNGSARPSGSDRTDQSNNGEAGTRGSASMREQNVISRIARLDGYSDGC